MNDVFRRFKRIEDVILSEIDKEYSFHLSNNEKSKNEMRLEIYKYIYSELIEINQRLAGKSISYIELFLEIINNIIDECRYKDCTISPEELFEIFESFNKNDTEKII